MHRFRIKNIRFHSGPKLESDSMFTFAIEASEKSGMFIQRSWFEALLKGRLRSGKASLRMLDENFFTLSHTMMFTRNLPYTEAFRNRVNQLISSGVPQRFYEQQMEKYRPLGSNDQIPPQVLTLEHLAVGFLIYLVVCAFCVLVFLIENLFSWFKPSH